MKKPILAVGYVDGKVYWEYGEDLKCWMLIGILESIKKELLETVDEESLGDAP